jgi:hypothetical protein
MKQTVNSLVRDVRRYRLLSHVVTDGAVRRAVDDMMRESEAALRRAARNQRRRRPVSRPRCATVRRAPYVDDCRR